MVHKFLQKRSESVLCKSVEGLYGTIHAAILFYEKLCCKFAGVGISGNKYDACVAKSGGTMSMGAGSIYSICIIQKLVSQSSTESEVVAVYDIVPQIIWTS
jgi:hypothetical protein